MAHEYKPRLHDSIYKRSHSTKLQKQCERLRPRLGCEELVRLQKKKGWRRISLWSGGLDERGLPWGSIDGEKGQTVWRSFLNAGQQKHQQQHQHSKARAVRPAALALISQERLWRLVARTIWNTQTQRERDSKHSEMHTFTQSSRSPQRWPNYSLITEAEDLVHISHRFHRLHESDISVAMNLK